MPHLPSRWWWGACWMGEMMMLRIPFASIGPPLILERACEVAKGASPTHSRVYKVYCHVLLLHH